MEAQVVPLCAPHAKVQYAALLLPPAWHGYGISKEASQGSCPTKEPSFAWTCCGAASPWHGTALTRLVACCCSWIELLTRRLRCCCSCCRVRLSLLSCAPSRCQGCQLERLLRVWPGGAAAQMHLHKQQTRDSRAGRGFPASCYEGKEASQHTFNEVQGAAAVGGCHSAAMLCRQSSWQMVDIASHGMAGAAVHCLPIVRRSTTPMLCALLYILYSVAAAIVSVEWL